MNNSNSIQHQDSTSNDDCKTSYLNLQNPFFRHIWQVDYSAPIHELLQKDGTKVLDVGCGTGMWVTEMSKNYPSSHFTGIEHLPLFPKNPESVTPNTTFFHCNPITSRLPFEDNYFDYVHCRNALMEFSVKELTDILIPEMIRVTKPEGYIEHCEVDERHVNEGPIMREITNSVSRYNASREIDGMIGEKLDEVLLKTGRLFNIHHQQKYSPMGSWGGDFGVMATEIFTLRCKNLRNELAMEMGLTPQEFDIKLANCIIEAESTRTYLKSHRIYAQKI